MKKVMFGLAVLVTIIPGATASACSTKAAKGGGECQKDGSVCVVYCGDGTKAGELTWNGSIWTDGVKFDKELTVAAKLVCDGNGKSCG